jgi:transposase
MSQSPISTENLLRMRIVALREEGFTLKEITARTDACRRKIQRVCKRFRETGSIQDRPRSGRPPLLNDRQKRVVAQILRKKEATNAESIRKVAVAHHDIVVSRDTIARTLQTFGYAARIKLKKPKLSIEHKRERLAWARNHSSWTIEDWKEVIWSDETKFMLVMSEGKEYVWIKEGERLEGHAVIPTSKFGGGKVMLWGCMTWEGVGFACKIDSTLDGELYSKILKGELMDTIEYYSLDQEEVIFQHDNDPKHRSKVAQDALDDLGLNVMSWPTQSPDLNPIEHLWVHLQKEIRKDPRIFATHDELWGRIEEELGEENKDLCRKLISTMPERVIDVIRAKGGYTRW